MILARVACVMGVTGVMGVSVGESCEIFELAWDLVAKVLHTAAYAERL